MQLAADFADSLCRTGALVRARASGYVVLNPEHARLFDKHGWSKADVRAAIAMQGWRSYRDLARAGKEAIAGGTGWRMKSLGRLARSVAMMTQRPVIGSFLNSGKRRL